MYVESIALKDFRNYQTLELSFSEGTNLFIGENAQGKTNILESLYLCATSKSHRSSKDHEMIRFGCQESHIRASFYRKDTGHRLDVHLKRGSAKGIAIDSRPIRRLADLMGMINVICFSPEDLSMVKEGPALRRHFMDMELCQLSPLYYHTLSSYMKVISQRNALLKQLSFDSSLGDTLDIWDMQLVSYGNQLIAQRREFIRNLSELAAPVHDKLSGGRENLILRYMPSCTEEEFEEKLFLQRDTDIRQKLTGIGPHRDDFAFLLNDLDLRRFGSQGQQRTAALSLKLSEIELVKKRTGETPVLLLDDVLSELDRNRQKDLLESIHGTQSFITCAGAYESIQKYVKIDKMFSVHDGKCREMILEDEE